jgi:hypothetical protein
MRSGIAVGIASALLLLLWSASAARAEAPARGNAGVLEGARLEIELLEDELATEKAQLHQRMQILKQNEFAFGLPGMHGPDPEERKKTLASIREGYEALKAATLETARKLAEARRRLAELEAPAPANSPPSSEPSTPAERRAALALLTLEYDVDKALLREALTKLGQVELERSLIPIKGPAAEDDAQRLERLRAYVDARKHALLERGIALERKKQELAESEKKARDEE